MAGVKSVGEHGSYRWIVVGASTAANAFAWGVRATFALFYVAMLGELTWGRGPTALGYSLNWLGFVVFAPIAGWLFDRWGARRVVIAGGLTLGVALALTGRVTSLAQYYLCFGLLGAAGIAGMTVPSTTIVTRWFVRKRGTAMGILSAGNSAGAAAFYPVNAWLIVTLGWRGALVAFGCAVAVATVSLALLYRDPPLEELPGGHDARAGDAECARVTGEAWTLRRVAGSVRLWAAFSMMVGNLLVGWLSDHLGRGWVFALGSVVAIAGIGCLAVTRSPHDLPLLLLYTVSGFGFGMRIAQLSAIPADAFSGPHLGTILGVVQAGGGLGGAIGPFLGGWLFDVTGSYQLAFAAAGVAVAGSAVAAWIAAPRRPRTSRTSTTALKP